MATTARIKNGTIEITGLDEDWTLEDDLGITGIHIDSIQFNPSATDDIMVIHDGGNDAIPIFEAKSNGYPITKYYNNRHRRSPVIDISDCTITTPSNAKVIIELGS